VRAALPEESREGAIANALALVETTIGAPGQGLDGRLAAFFDAFAALSADPTSAVARDGVALQGRQLATAFNDVARRLADSGRQADVGVRESVGEVNTLTTQIAALNDAIATSAGDVEALKDQRQTAIERLSTLTAVSVLTRADGGVDVTIPSGRALVIGGSAYPITISSGAGGYATLTLGTADITTELTSGTIGGLSHTRDSQIPTYLAQLDALAYGVAQEVNALHQAGFDVNGAAGVAFFTPLAGPSGAAAALAVNPAITANTSLIAASQTGAPGDNGTARALAALRDQKVLAGGTATFTEGWAQLAYQVGADAESARAEQQSRHDVATQVLKLRDQVSGVSMDEEAASLLKFQRAYEANARYFTAVDDMLLTLMSLAGAD
jgi:flagellar hook-associated protein 1 FlgK